MLGDVFEVTIIRQSKRCHSMKLAFFDAFHDVDGAKLAKIVNSKAVISIAPPTILVKTDGA